MNRITQLLLATGVLALTFTSCGETEAEAETPQVIATVETLEAQEWSDFVEAYNPGYDTIEGNETWDGKEVIITGIVEKALEYSKASGEDFIQVGFGVAEDFFETSQLLALFPVEDMPKLQASLDSTTAITFSGTVDSKKLDEITIKDCVLK